MGLLKRVIKRGLKRVSNKLASMICLSSLERGSLNDYRKSVVKESPESVGLKKHSAP